MTDKQKVVALLKEALANELVSYYQYWICSTITNGLWKRALSHQFLNQSLTEKEHAEKITKRLVELKAIPILSPFELQNFSSIDYIKPKNTKDTHLLSQILQRKHNNILRYNEIFEKLKYIDEISAKLILEILQEEITQEDNLEITFIHISSKEHHNTSLLSL